MSVTIYRVSVPMFNQTLAALSDICQMAEDHCAESGSSAEEILESRFAPDMFPMAQQIRRATFHAARAVAELAGVEVPDYADDEKSFADLRTRIKYTRDFLSSITPDQLEGSDKKELKIQVGPNLRDFIGEDFLFHFAIPQVYFHSTTAYDLIRAAGVEVGKRHFLGSPENR